MSPELRDQLVKRARQYERAGDLQMARSAWSLLAKHSPQDAHARSEVFKLDRLLARLQEIDRLLHDPNADVEGRVRQALERSEFEFLVLLRRRQLKLERRPHTLVALASALRRSRNGQSPEWDEADALLTESLSIDSSKVTNAGAYTALGALLRARGEHRAAREILVELHHLHPTDGFVAEALAAVHLDAWERSRSPDGLDEAQRLTNIALARFGRSREVAALYGRLDALRRRL